MSEHRRDDYRISTEPASLDVPAIHAYLSRSHWAAGIPLELVRKAIAHSDVVRAHPDLQSLRRFLLATRDAHGLYQQYGFKELAAPARLMEVMDVDVYTRGTAAPSA